MSVLAVLCSYDYYRTMKRSHYVLISAIACLVIWAILTWPLPQRVASAIPASGRSVEPIAHRVMIPGDHLQLMYYFWLFGDMLTGHTPWFHNLYEFNVGDDAARFFPHSFFFPFSLVFALVAPISMALAWNFTGFLSLWLTLLTTWVLISRLTKDVWGSFIIALLAFLLPYRWMSLLGGSPTGFAMLWVPVVLLGLESGVRRGKATGGALAGMGWLFACWTDLHVFYFLTLLMPIWIVICLVWPNDAQGGTRYSIRNTLHRVGGGLWPMIFFVMGIAVYVVLTRRRLDASLMAAGRTVRETLLYAKPVQSLWNTGTWEYTGYVLPLLGIGAIAFGWTWRRWGRSMWRLALAWCLCIAGALAIGVLASGPRGPFRGYAYLLVRSLIPRYDMIRQPAKILCLMPSVLAVAGAAGLSLLHGSGMVWTKRKFVRGCVGGLILLAGMLDYVFPYARANVAVLEAEQQAYAAVAQEAARANEVPRALVVPLWPGDSHYASVYQYYASLYRIRLVNGYSPSVDADYFENVFRRFESINQGGVRDKELDDLLQLGVRHIILHENLFPAQVSPFRVARTLYCFLDEPRLRLLAQDGSVWAFRIEEHPLDAAANAPEWETWFPTRIWQADRLRYSQPATIERGAYESMVHLADGQAAMTRAVHLHEAPGLRWKVRVRGRGSLFIDELNSERDVINRYVRDVVDEEWHWLSIPVDTVEPGTERRALRVSGTGAPVALSTILLAAGEWKGLEPHSPIELLAPLFFHMGYTQLESNAITLRADCEPSGLVFFGPHLPLAEGQYDVQWRISSSGPEGLPLGSMQVRMLGGPSGEWVPVITGKEGRILWEQEANQPFWLQFHYNRNADVTIESIVISRL